MDIAIINLTGGGLSGGYAKYLRELVPLLLEQRGVRARVYLHPRAASRMRERLPDVRSWPRWDHLVGFRTLRAELARSRPDVLFFPTARHFHVGSVPTVSMVRNMGPLTLPFEGGLSAELVRNADRIASAWLAARRATRVIAVSGFVRDFLMRRFRVDASKIGVVPHGVDPPPRAEDLVRPSALAGETGPFLFTAGSIRPARGLEDVVGALGVLARRGVRPRLVIAGGIEPSMGHYLAELERRARSLGVADAILWAGRLAPHEMSWCMLNARAFVMTSRVEACPNLVLEAMSHGCLSVSSDAPPMPEFFGESAAFYRSGDPASLADGIVEVLGAAEDRANALRVLGRARAAEYSWTRTARSTLAELERAVEEGLR